ncbi:MAG: 23S rRNA (guanosine(2251)-2'-O)-methyltransferase RlmB [bacterium]|nr:23S rRNA (guanosine(2251)-2'-O)-methyltransferase RlmB [bacterium]MDE0601237.1 23S rRNA (guanosine(2251)-2'-O)-methyltransferase RlmB [bacterium]
MALAGYGARVEGIPAVGAALEAGRVRKLRVENRSASSPRMAELLGSARGRGVEVEMVSSLEGTAVTASPQGVLAECRQLRSVTLTHLAAEETPAALLVVDHISDPRNLGAIARNAVAAGTPRLVIPRRRGSPLTPTAFKASAGALEKTRVCVVSSIAETLSQLSRMGVWTIGLAAHAPTSLLGLELLKEPAALVVGGEHQGLSRLVAQRVDQLASIPMVGETESLNASFAAGMALFELARVRGYLRKP